MDGWALGMEYVSTYGRVRWDIFGGGPPLVLVHGTPFSLMIVWGEEDRWIPLEKGEQLHKAIPGSQLRTIPRCAHLAQEDAPEAVAAFLTEFLVP